MVPVAACEQTACMLRARVTPYTRSTRSIREVARSILALVARSRRGLSQGSERALRARSRTLLAASSAMRRRVPTVADPMWGTTSKFGQVNSGCAGGSGSGSVTSSAAPAIVPARRASPSASEVYYRTAPDRGADQARSVGLMVHQAARASTRCRVRSESGTCSQTKSHSARSSGSDWWRRPRRRPSRARGGGVGSRSARPARSRALRGEPLRRRSSPGPRCPAVRPRDRPRASRWATTRGPAPLSSIGRGLREPRRHRQQPAPSVRDRCRASVSYARRVPHRDPARY